MIDEFNVATKEFGLKWQKLVEERKDKRIFESARPISIGWKVADKAAFDICYAELLDLCDQVHLKWMNERWIATMILREPSLEWGMQVVKLMQRRPGSSDTLGFDHLDFYTPDVGDAAAMQAAEPDLKWTDEVNGLCKWTSLWFDGTEAKMRRESVVEVCIAELKEANENLLG